MTVRRRVWASKSPGKIVVRYVDGRLVKGYAPDFHPDQPCFHVVPADDADGEAVEVRIEDLKAVFFVRSFAGNREYDESNDLYVDRPPGTRKVRVEFADGEILVGYMTAYDPRRRGFFLSPLDPKSNNAKIFAVSAAVTTVTRLL